jgi:1,4-dihydroxy-2-naphthoate octaprenyltransferase
LSYGTVAGLLSAAIMLVNNLRDIPTDAPAGKMTLAVVIGDGASRKLYIALLSSAAAIHLLASLSFSWLLSLLPTLILLPYVFMLSYRAMHLQGAELNRLLASTARLLLAYCLLSSMVLIR